MDDFFGGPKRTNQGIMVDKRKAKLLFDLLLAVGDLTGTVMNREKCHPPARIMDTLGFCYDSISRTCKLSKENSKIFAPDRTHSEILYCEI